MRNCVNPDCLRECEDDHETICTECGWGTRAVEKKEKPNGGDRQRRDKLTSDSGLS